MNGQDLHQLGLELFPICWSLTGNGVRTTLKRLQEILPLTIHEVPSGTRVFDWTVPEEWNPREAWIKDPDGNKIVDFGQHNLHLLGYSTPIHTHMDLEELKGFLYTLEDHPDWIPYLTSYYEKRWGFCMTHRQYESLQPGSYEVFIDADLEAGSLTYADLVIPGEREEEIVISTYVCHPSMANNELSGPLIATGLAHGILQRATPPRYTMRFIFVPETIGPITYLSRNLDHLKSKVIAGYVATCIGDPGPFTYLRTRHGETLTDRVTEHLLRHCNRPTRFLDYYMRSSDERQYNAPGVDLPMGSLMRTRYKDYPEYHTSADNFELVTAEALDESLRMYQACIELLEKNRTYQASNLCEPQLGRHGLHDSLSRKGSSMSAKPLKDLLAYADGTRDLIAIADHLNYPAEVLIEAAEKLTAAHLIYEVDAT